MDKECLYCKMDENGEPPDDVPYRKRRIFTARLGTLFGNKVAIDGMLWGSNLVLYFSPDDYGFARRVKINYCPMCGKRLAEEK